MLTDLERWERNFAGAAGLFDDDFRQGIERLHSFIRAVRSFLEGIESYVLRELPTTPVYAYAGITELMQTVAHLDESTSDLDADLRGLGAAEDTCRLESTLLGEDPRNLAFATPT